MIIRALRAGLAGMYLIAVPAIQAQEESQSEPAGIEPEISVTEHSIDLPGGGIDYTVTTGETFIRDGDGKPRAAIFSTSYIAESGNDNRPVFFIWNGGPGSSSVWLHMGAFGPKRVAVPPDARDDGAPIPLLKMKPRFWMWRTWYSLILSARASAARWAKPKARTSTACTRMPGPSHSLSANG